MGLAAIGSGCTGLTSLDLTDCLQVCSSPTHCCCSCEPTAPPQLHLLAKDEVCLCGSRWSRVRPLGSWGVTASPLCLFCHLFQLRDEDLRAFAWSASEGVLKRFPDAKRDAEILMQQLWGLGSTATPSLASVRSTMSVTVLGERGEGEGGGGGLPSCATGSS